MSCQTTRPSRFSDCEEGDMGIGTMMVFIAVILVSAVAAGMLINTAYLIQQQAEETGTIAITSVATTFIVHDVVGDRNDALGDPQEEIQFLELKLALAAGSPRLAMENVLIEATTAYGEANLALDTSGAAQALMHQWTDPDAADANALKALASGGTYTAMELRDPDDTFYTTGVDYDNPDFVVGQGTLVRVFINLADNGLNIGTQDWLSLKIIPKHGTPTYERVVAPETMGDRYITF